MIGLLQRVREASVVVDDKVIATIGRGLLVLAAVHRDDTEADISRLAQRICQYRVFADAAGRMNRSLLDTGFELLLVPQFTLAADTQKGNRPSFTRAAAPETGSAFFDKLAAECAQRLGRIQCGQFGADMQVALVNDGPVTFWLET